jgi:hypothetical protein
MIEPPKSSSPIYELLSRAEAEFREERASDLRDLIAQKTEDLRGYDVLSIDRVASILCWGRSGSLLLASYFDGHEDVLMLPELRSEGIYQFFEQYRPLSLRNKLIGYAALGPTYPQFFEGSFAISRSHYYAAVEAIVESYKDCPAELLESRRVFFVLVHIAYNLALGRRTSARPLIIYAQHEADDRAARQLVEDFPCATFLQTIRDPLSCYNSLVRFMVEGWSRACRNEVYRFAMLGTLASTGRAPRGMESRTRTIRLEDLHRNPASIMRDLADWLGIDYQNILLESTFNGIPYVVTRNAIRDGADWCGRNLEQTRRIAPDLTRKDRALLFALFYENFVQWKYPCPKILGNRLVRCLVVAGLFVFPLNTEGYVARAVWKHRALPSFRRRDLRDVIRCFAGIALIRFKTMSLLVLIVAKRCLNPPVLVQVQAENESREIRTADVCVDS